MNQGTNQDRGSLERMGEQIGAAAGTAFGRGADMAAGMVGALFGSAMNTLGNWWSTADANRAAESFDQNRDRVCREHFQSNPTATNRDYDQVRPLYQFGHVAGQNPDYQGKDFSAVEPDLRRAWDDASQQELGDWPEVRGYVGFGFSQENPGGSSSV